MAYLKQVVWSLAVVLIAAGIFAGMVLYTISTLRSIQMQMLTGDITQSIIRQEK